MNACTLVHAHTCVHTHIMHMYNLNVVDGGSGPCPLQTASKTKMQAHKVKTAMLMPGETVLSWFPRRQEVLCWCCVLVPFLLTSEGDMQGNVQRTF